MAAPPHPSTASRPAAALHDYFCTSPILFRCTVQARPKDIKVSQLSGAMTNLVYRCRYQREDEVRPLLNHQCKLLSPGFTNINRAVNCANRAFQQALL